MLYLVTFTDGSQGVYTQEQLWAMLSDWPWMIASYEVYEPEPPPPVYTCPICGATFASQAALDAHIATAHPPPVYTCPYCGATFTSQAALDSHIATAHPPAVVPCEITITAPDSAQEGGTVNVSVKIKNVSAYHYSYEATIYAVPDLYPDYVIGTIDQVIMSGSSVTRSASFTMPDCDVTVLVWVERWAADRWVYDNSASRVVSLAVPATYHLDIFVPTWAYGGYVEPGSGDYPANTTITLRAYPLSGYQFLSWGRDASGTDPTYNLLMNSDKNVEAYFEKVPVEEFAGTISKKELEYDETRRTIPVY